MVVHCRGRYLQGDLPQLPTSKSNQALACNIHAHAYCNQATLNYGIRDVCLSSSACQKRLSY
jgi:hypothetical protein